MMTTVDLGALLDAGDGAVVILEAGKTRLAAHRAVLAAGSPVFGHDTLEAGSSRVGIPDVEGPVLRLLLAYLYTRRAPQLPAITASQLLAAADKYGVLELKDECEQQLAVETAAASALLAVRHSCPNLEDAAVTFVKANSQVFATRGWAHAVRTRPEEVVKLSQLLAEPPAGTETSAPATKRRRTTSRTPPQTCQGRTSVTAAPLVALHTSPPSADTAISNNWRLRGDGRAKGIIQAVMQGAVGELQTLLAAEADVGASEKAGATALLWAATEGREDVARRLLEAGVDANARDALRNTPLLWAAMNGHESVVRLLVAAGADPNAANVDGTTPLHWAADCGHTEVAVALLEAGADREARENNGSTPLQVARSNDHHLLAGLLITENTQ